MSSKSNSFYRAYRGAPNPTDNSVRHPLYLPPEQFNQFSSIPLSIAINNSVRKWRASQRLSSGRGVAFVGANNGRKRRNSSDLNIGNKPAPFRSSSLCVRTKGGRELQLQPKLDNLKRNQTFRNGDLVWFVIPGEGASSEPFLYYPGVVIEYHVKGGVVTIKPEDPEQGKDQFIIENNATYVRKRSLESSSGVMDMITMNDLSEPALLWNIRQRYKNGHIYTYVGSMLISVNPYKMYDNIYGLPVVKKYEGRVLGDLPPHLFALASGAYARMCKDKEAQVVVISGESGSGKTECTKLILGYLALVNKSPSNLITEQILEATPLLESFGNAKTTKNDNSSRFGKYLQVCFDESTSTSIITSCKVTEYLLEKSRIVTQNRGERNYHVFYELLAGLSKEQKDKYGLLEAEKYFYLNQGAAAASLGIGGKNDADDFTSLVSAMQILGFSSAEIDCVFRVLGSVLHLGNVYFHRKGLKGGMEGVEIGSDAELQWIAHLLEISPEGLRRLLTTRVTESGRGDKIHCPLTIDQSLDTRDAIAKILYSNLFSWLVQRVNRIVGGGPSPTCINILDIFGFENFKENSFEQLCINYANESLHHFLTRYVFKLEQAEYVKEKIEWAPIEFEENGPVLALLVKKPVGILHLLDDESNFPKGTDSSFLEKCHYNHALNESYLRQRMSSKEFGVKHYAGNVWYNTEGFLEKNRGDFASNSQQDFALRKLLCGSKEKILARMFILGAQMDHQTSSKPNNNRSGSREKGQKGTGSRLFLTMKPRAPTISARFTSSLNSLLESMSKASPWFIRCIKPNNEKKPNLFDSSLVLDQLRYSGILETIKIRKLGYPIRYGFLNFVTRYKCLIPPSQRQQSQSTRDLTRLILTSAGGQDFQLGATKVFLRETLEQRLEKGRYELLNSAAQVIQAAARGHLQHKKYLSQRRAAVTIQSGYKGYVARRDYLKMRRGFTKLQATTRMRRDLRRYRAVREEMMKRNQKRKVVEAGIKAQQNQLSYGLTGVNHLEIPAELAFILSRLEPGEEGTGTASGRSNHLHGTLKKIGAAGELAGSPQWSTILANVKAGKLKLVKEELRMRREPIVSPFLKTSPKDEALTIFKLILRFMNDTSLGAPPGRDRELLLLNYIVNKGLRNELIRDEILVQILNQTTANPNRQNAERGWLLLAGCLAGFQPRDEGLFNYLLYHFSSSSEEDEDGGMLKGCKGICQTKCLQMGEEGKRGRTRALPPFSPAEQRTLDRRMGGVAQVSLEIDGIYERIESWSVVSEIAGNVGRKRWGGKFWSLDYFINEEERLELDPSGFLFDVNFEAVEYGQFGKVFGAESHSLPPSPSLLFAKAMYANSAAASAPGSKIKQGAMAGAVESPHQRVSPLSAKSKLNNRYFKAEYNSRTKSLDNLLHESVDCKMMKMGLSDSKLNQRYINSSIENLSNGRGYFVDEEEELQVDFNSEEDDEEFEPELVVSSTRMEFKSSGGSGGGVGIGAIGKSGRSGPPRYIKAMSGSRGKGPSSVGSKSYGKMSSAMSDTSEAPSLASHVRRVRVPSQASDVDQFLDDLFSPVLGGGMDDLSDVRSLMSNIKGGGNVGVGPSKVNPASFIQSAMEQNIQIQQQLIEQNQALQELLRRSSTELEPAGMNGGSGIPPPPPPPLPPNLLCEANNSHRPFMDPYGRAKTVRIGKWRWPPKEDELDGDGFQQFRARLEEKRRLDEDDEDDELGQPPHDWLDKQPHNPKLRNGLGPKNLHSVPPPPPPQIRNPFGDISSVGKLKLSSEMRAKLEQVTSVRVTKKGGGAAGQLQGGSSSSIFETDSPVKKLDEGRRNILQEKLMGNGRVIEAVLHPPPPPPIPISNKDMRGDPDENYDSLSQVYNQVAHHQKIKERDIEPPDYSDSEGEFQAHNRLRLHPAPANSYALLIKRFRLRKDLLLPDELNKFPELEGFLREQILQDIKWRSPRILEAERNSLHGSAVHGNLVEIARNWSLYFWRFFKIRRHSTGESVNYLALSEKGLKTVGLRGNRLFVSEFFPWSKIVSVLASKSSSSTTNIINITLGNGQKIQCSCEAALALQRTADTLFTNDKKHFHNKGAAAVEHGGGGGGQHINMMKSANSRAMASHQHQIQHKRSDSYEMEDIEFEQAEELEEATTSPPAHFSRRLTAAANSSSSSYYNQHEGGSNNNEEMSVGGGGSDDVGDFASTQPYKNSTSGSPPIRHQHHLNNEGGGYSPRGSSGEEEAAAGRGPTFENDGKHSLLQFALKYFRQKDKFQQQYSSSSGGQEKGEEQGANWTWREQVSCVKYSPKMIQGSLIPLEGELNKLALECFASILKYMGDYPESLKGGGKKGGGSKHHGDPNHSPPAVPPPLLTEVEAVYTLLRNCHLAAQSPYSHRDLGLADEVYCQIMKQTTNNTNPKAAQRGWRLFTILAAYFNCSDTLKPYLFKYLETSAYDKRRAFHGTALVALQNLRKTFRYGGRRNVPSVEEITAITAGRNAKRQIFRLPGGAQRVVNVKATTVVQDVLEELCSSCLHMEGASMEERGEWSVYCIVEGDTTMPLQREEYILDVTTELQKNGQVYYLIFCRSVWYFPLRLEQGNNDTYVDLIFNQIAPDYLEGLLLTMPGQMLEQSLVYDISRIAALLHRAADLRSPPTLKETKYLLPKPALAARDMRPQQWVSLVAKYWMEERMEEDKMKPIQAKTLVLDILQKWDLFGSSFFSVKRMSDPSPPEEYILALNKNGVHFLDIITHETLNWWNYSEIISTRKVKNEDGLLYLDLKVGNLMQQRITRLQTEHAHEISRLIKQYIHIQKYSQGNTSSSHSPMSGK